MRPTLAIALLLVACGGSSKPAPAAPTEEVAVTTPGNDVDSGGEAWGPEESEEREETPEEPYQPPPPLDQASVDAGGTGSLACDELITRTKCMYVKAGAAVPAEAIKAFEDGTKMWVEALVNEATRAAVMDACKMSVDAGKAGFDAVGC